MRTFSYSAFNYSRLAFKMYTYIIYHIMNKRSLILYPFRNFSSHALLIVGITTTRTADYTLWILAIFKRKKLLRKKLFLENKDKTQLNEHEAIFKMIFLLNRINSLTRSCLQSLLPTIYLLRPVGVVCHENTA